VLATASTDTMSATPTVVVDSVTVDTGYEWVGTVSLSG
jgi:hypothetical protein